MYVCTYSKVLLEKLSWLIEIGKNDFILKTVDKWVLLCFTQGVEWVTHCYRCVKFVFNDVSSYTINDFE